MCLEDFVRNRNISNMARHILEVPPPLCNKLELDASVFVKATPRQAAVARKLIARFPFIKLRTQTLGLV